MTRRARDLLSQKKSVLIDASFLRENERKLARSLSEEAPCRFHVLEISCPEDVVKKRIKERIKEGTVSDATIDIYEAQKRFYEPPTEFDDETVIKVDTTKPAGENLKDILERILLGKKPSPN
jgi:predicted kinase